MAKSTIQRRTRRKKASRPGGKLTLKDRLSRLTFRCSTPTRPRAIRRW